MKKLQRVRTRRQLLRATAAGVLRATAVGAVSIPFLALARKSASAQGGNGQGGNGQGGLKCFLKGTKISTPSGDRLVQDLRIGDEVQTLAGRKTIKWIGYNKFTKEEGRAWQDSVMPIRVARFAIDDHTPHCDLYLSPWHCIFLNQALIPVMYLINEATIAQGTPSDTPAIEYYHIELDTHEVIYAEGALVESFIDDDSNRENFSNFVQYERLYGAEPQSKMTPFAPILRYRGRREELKGLVRSLISNVVDVRDPIQSAYEPPCPASGSGARLTVGRAHRHHDDNAMASRPPIAKQESIIASSVNKMILVGNLGRDPEIRHTRDGRPVAKRRRQLSSSTSPQPVMFCNSTGTGAGPTNCLKATAIATGRQSRSLLCPSKRERCNGNERISPATAHGHQRTADQWSRGTCSRRWRDGRDVARPETADRRSEDSDAGPRRRVRRQDDARHQRGPPAVVRPLLRDARRGSA